jgi:small subunit ribosomal protein S18
MRRFYVPKNCYFCTQNIDYIDYKDVKLLQRFLSYYAKIQPRKRTGTCAKHQRVLVKAIKRARHVALLPFVSR